jgi:hypothetical protein
MEQQLTAGLGKGQIAEFVENDEVPPGEIFGDASLPRTCERAQNRLDFRRIVHIAMGVGRWDRYPPAP